MRACDWRDRHPIGDVEIFMDISATDDQIAGVRDALSRSPLVHSVQFMTHEDSLRELRLMFADKPKLLRGTTPADLPTSFLVDLEDGVPSEGSLDGFQTLPGVDEIKPQNSAADCGITS